MSARDRWPRGDGGGSPERRAPPEAGPVDERAAVLLLTGRPGVGKTTCVLRALDAVRGDRVRARGFVTREVREGGRRRGFEVQTLDGRQAMLAAVDIASPHRVGRYGVDLDAFEAIALPELHSGAGDADLTVVDEVGRMECLSRRFVAAVRKLLEAGRPALLTVARRGGGAIAEVRRHPGACLVEFTEGNRDALPARLAAWIRARCAKP